MLPGVLIPLLAQRAGISNRGFENLRMRLGPWGIGVRGANASGTLTGVLIPLLAQRAGISNRGFENLRMRLGLGGLGCGLLMLRER